jgi:hypothetical protein
LLVEAGMEKEEQGKKMKQYTNVTCHGRTEKPWACLFGPFADGLVTHAYHVRLGAGQQCPKMALW